MERVSATHVGGEAVIVEIKLFGVFIKDHVLDHGAEFFGGGVNLGLCLSAEVDRLGVAATFEIECPVIRPAVFIVTNQRPARIGG